MNEITLETVRELCMNYDKEEGAYPESLHEGYSVYQYILNKIKNEVPSFEEWEAEVKAHIDEVYRKT